MLLLQADSDGNVIPSEAMKLMKSLISLTDETFWGAVERICTKGNKTFTGSLFIKHNKFVSLDSRYMDNRISIYTNSPIPNT
jgi:hypothetical protein